MKRKRERAIDILIIMALGNGTGTLGVQIFVTPGVGLKITYIILTIISAIATVLHLRRVSGK